MQGSARQYNTYWMYIKRTCFPEDLSDIFCSGQPRKKGRELKTKQNKTRSDHSQQSSASYAGLFVLEGACSKTLIGSRLDRTLPKDQYIL